MTSLTSREKAFMFAITLLIIIVLGYFFGIRNLNKQYDEYQAELQALQERKAYLDALRDSNANMTIEIEELKKACSTVELSFIDQLENEALEQYVLKTFEDAKCPFLMSVSSTDIGMPSVPYADGSTSEDGLVCTEISVTYSSTDGYTVTQYNRTPDLTSGSKVPVEDTIAELQEKMGQDEYAVRKGYTEFLTALKKINQENPSCIKVTSITATDAGGYMILNATIEFYATSLKNRISVDESRAPYTYWCGHTNVDTSGGFIGFPYVCDNKNSLWYGVENMNLEEGGNKPFAAYWAVIAFNDNLNTAGGDYKVLLNFEDAEEAQATPTPAPAA